LELERKKVLPEPREPAKYSGIPATMIAPVFGSVLFDIKNKEHTEYVFPGGRGGTKSSFISLAIIDLLMMHDDIHAVVGRQVADTLRTSVYQQVVWAISALGLDDEFHCTVSPLEITRVSTGQKIYFRGADDPGKIKSIKVPFGYIGILWLEELDQFSGEESVRKIEQSVIRGGDLAYIFKSFNPPKSANNWANKYVKIPKATRLVTWSTYLDVPKAWLGKPFIDDAEFLKEVNPTAYENEYMGVANGTGGNVFDNVTIREITDEEIFGEKNAKGELVGGFDRLYYGVDWGWYPDPWAFNKMHYNAAQHKLYIFDEDRRNKTSNEVTARILQEDHGIKANDKIVCDSAENKSVSDYKEYGLFARPAIKGPGSVEYSMKWLQSLREIIIDNLRCPETTTEFLEYEYGRDKEGNVISGYPDANNHQIDAVRYAMEEVWKRRGQ
jgi:PBSX family phage terminase large subunit